MLEETEQAANKIEEENQVLRSQLREKDEIHADQLQAFHAIEEEKDKAQVSVVCVVVVFLLSNYVLAHLPPFNNALLL